MPSRNGTAACHCAAQISLDKREVGTETCFCPRNGSSQLSRGRETRSFLAGLAFSGGVGMLVLGATGIRPALIAGIAILALLAFSGLIVGAHAWRHRRPTVTRRYHEKPSVTDPSGFVFGDSGSGGPGGSSVDI